MRLILRWLITTVALYAAAWLVSGIRVDSRDVLTVGAMALVLGLVNAFVRPLLKLLSCPLIILTLGFFILIINAMSLYLASILANAFGIGFYVDSFASAFLGAVVVSVVSILLNLLLPDPDERPRQD